MHGGRPTLGSGRRWLMQHRLSPDFDSGTVPILIRLWSLVFVSRESVGALWRGVLSCLVAKFGGELDAFD